MRRTMSAALCSLLASCGPKEEAKAPPSGQRLFSECAVCHTAAPPDTPAGRMRLVGPSLWGVYGRKAGAVDGYDYSRPLRNAPLVWDDETLDAFLERPQAVIPNNRMSYGGENDAEKRRAIVEYLKTLK